MTTTNNIETILESKQFVKSGITFQSPREILNPVIEIFNNLEFTGFASHPSELGENDNILTSFGRAGLIAKLMDSEDMNYQIGFIYSVEQGKPFIKTFAGFNIHICSNMCIFNTRNIAKFDMLTNMAGSYEAIKEFISNATDDYKKGINIINAMRKTEINLEGVKNLLGHLCLSFSSIKNIAGTNCILSASKLLTDKESIYYFENKTNCWNVYNALTHGFNDKTHIIDQPEKVLAIYREMANYCNNFPESRQLEISM